MKYKVRFKLPDFPKDMIINEKCYCYGHLINAKDFPDVFEPIKEPIFTTFDGVEFFEKYGTVYSVDKRDFEMLTESISELDIETPNDPNTYYLFFSSKESAEKYIFENKPIFSRKQIIDVLNKYITSDTFHISGIYRELKLDNNQQTS